MTSTKTPLVQLLLGATASILFAFGALTGCSDDSTDPAPAEEETDAAGTCGFGQYFDFLSETCIDLDEPDLGQPDTGSPGDTSPQPDTGDSEDVEEPDAPGDTHIEDEQPEPGCDLDGDGALSMECGGDDCDDSDPKRTPGRPEACDDLDNNCNELVNDNIECGFYAHTGDHLYLIDPFRGVATQISEVPRLFDIDTHPDGTLYGITGDELFFFDAPRRRWISIGEFPTIEDGTGLAIDSLGVAFVTAGPTVFTVDLITARTETVGDLGGGFFSSGDSVVNKLDTLYMTSKAFDEPDTLVLVNRDTGQGTAIGSIGFTGVYGLTAGWGVLYGMTSRGELIQIDPNTGQGTLLHTFTDLRWFGAASTPGR